MELAKAHGPECVERLLAWARSDHASASPAACQILLDRGFGKPKQSLEHTGADGGPIQTQDVTDERPDLATLAARAKGAAVPTKH